MFEAKFIMVGIGVKQTVALPFPKFERKKVFRHGELLASITLAFYFNLILKGFHYPRLLYK